ncbi:hypothetical protein [Paenibacillus sp. EPM92]|uniref:hypothetical protein n=1 Tax=Paenibacillus sp. EPM92 TaxID=1561195 RepID=UPI0019165D9F|nr:hypothetical protein [Paenibacillus sp. EPM92]
MRKLSIIMASLALSFSLFSASAFAAEPPTEGAANPTPTSQSSLPTQPEQLTDNSQRVITDGLYVDIYYPTDQSSTYIPEFTLDLWDVQTNSKISSATGNSQNFANGKYSMIFNHPGYKLGDELALILRKTDSIIEQLDFNGIHLKPNTHHKFTIDQFTYYEGDNDEQSFQDLTATKLHPLTASMVTDPKMIGLSLQSESGTPLKGREVEIKLQEGKGSLKATSDDNGLIWLDTDKLTWKFLVSAKGLMAVDGSNGKVEIELPATDITNTQKSTTILPVAFKSAEQSAVDSKISVSLSTVANSDLSKAWSEFYLTLTDANGVSSTHALNLESTTIQGLADGQYKLEMTAKYTDITLESDAFSVQGGIGGFKGTIEPKHVLEISKDGKPYSFSVINVHSVADKQYKGTNPQIFAVTPGESFMIKDNDTGRVETVAIDANSPTTRLILGAGVVFGGSASTPHTGDPIVYLVILLGVAILLSLFFGVMYLNSKSKKTSKKSAPTTKLMSLLLAFTLVASLFSTIAPTLASAAGSDANVGGTGPATGNATSRTPAGSFQVSDKIAVLQFGFIPNKVKSNGEMVLSAPAGVSDLEDPFKFDYERLMFYMAPSQVSDTLWRKQRSGLITFERGQGVRTLYGSNPLYPGIQAENSRDDLMKRTLEYADLTRSNSDSDINYFKEVIADVLFNIDPNDPNRSLSGEGNDVVIGDSLKSMIEDYISKRKDDSEIDAQIIGSLMFSGYLDLIKFKGVLAGAEYTAFEQMMRDKFKKGELIFFAQTIIGISVQNGGNPQARDYAFMPMHDATDWYLNTRQSARPTDKVVQGLTANKEFEAVSLGGATSADQGSLSPYKENGNIPFSFRTYARDYYARTLKPVTDSVPMSSDYKVNGFGGWGFQPWGYGDGETGNKPTITADLNVTVVDKVGNPTNESFTVPINGWVEESEKYLDELESNDDTVIIGGMSVEHDGKTYDLVPNENATFTLVDIKDEENINKLQLTKDVIGEDGVIPVPVDSNSSTWEIRLGYDTPLPLEMNKYLGGDASSGSSSIENKYEGTGKFSNAQVTLFVQAREDDPNNEKVETNLEVPQWRLSKYWNDISPSAKTPATFNLSLPIETFRNPSISPTGVTFSLLNPDLSKAPWAISRAKLFDDTPYRSFSPYNTSAKFNLAGDLLAIKDNGSISNNKFASWVNNIALFDNRIESTSKGSPDGQATVTKDFLLQYGVKSGVDPFRYTEDKRVPVGSSCNEFGCWTIWGWEPRTANATSNYKTADYDTSIRFDNYLSKDSAAPKTIENASESVNGKYWETNQSNDTLNVNPEVLMAYDDQSGNTSVAFVAGDKLRPIKPVSYNVAQFVNVDVLPTVTGMSVATDSNAKQLAKSLNAADKEVLYKGSAVTTNFEVKGQLELKTFALDIGNNAFKSDWNPSNSYSTDAINEAFLSKYASKDETTGKWGATLDADGKLVIDGKEYGGKQGKVVAEQSDESVKTYLLEVRGGKLIGVNDNRNLDSLPSELKEALTRMHILSDDNVFNVFERGTGAKLGEDIVATLGNMVRGSNDLTVGKGFYNEDSTSLVVREYITTFDLPSYMTADKLPMEIPGLEVQMDKNQLFSKGALGNTLLQYKVGKAEMIADSSKGEFGVKKSTQYVVGNASVLDSFSSQ